MDVMKYLTVLQALASIQAYLLLEYTGEARDIADPWYTGNFDVTYDDVKEGCEAFLQYLMENEPLY